MLTVSEDVFSLSRFVTHLYTKSEYFIVFGIMFSAYKATGSQRKLEDSGLKIISMLGDR